MNEHIGEYMTAAVSICFLTKSPLQVTKCFSVGNLGLKHKGQWPSLDIFVGPIPSS